jgi:hypothetical protein
MKRIKTLIVLFQIGMFFSGITAFFIPWGIDLIMDSTIFENTSLHPWLTSVQLGIHDVDSRYQFFFYGTDWLAFAHVLFAILFIGAYRDPIRNKWLFQFGIIASILIFPLALIMGYTRGIPIQWQLMDCCFGVVAGVLLYFTLRIIKRYETIELNHQRGALGTWAHTQLYTL